MAEEMIRGQTYAGPYRHAKDLVFVFQATEGY